MTNTMTEQQLFELFRTQLPPLPIPAEFRLSLQQRLLAETMASIKPTVREVSRIATSPTWVRRLRSFFRRGGN